jgi:hypothetical protein
MSDQNDPKVIERYLQERRARLTAMLRDDTFANVAIEMEAADRIEELEVAIEAYRVAIEAYRRDPTLLMPTGPGVDVRYAEEAEGGVHGNAVRPNPVPPTVKERYE